jgi:hypothetical protein
MARLKIKSEPIDSYVYEVTQLGAVEGKRIYAQVLKMVLPALGAALKGRDLSGISKADVAGMALDEIAVALVRSLDGVDAIIETLAKTTDIYGPGFGDAGAPMWRNFDEHFAGKYLSLSKWFLFALKANFQDFIEGVASAGSILASINPAKVSPSQSP